MFKNTKMMLLASAAVIMIPAGVSMAATTSIDATASFLAAIALANEVDMDFGNIEFAAAPGAGDTATMDTAGNIAYAGNFSGPATGTPGSVDVTGGTDGNVLEIECSSSATLSDGAGASIDLVSIQVQPEGGAAAACQGAGTPAATMTLDIGGGTADQFTFGGQLDGSTAASFVGGSYSTANAGGTNITIDVNYQ